MPLPTPNDGESEDDFIERCMGNPTAVEDFPEPDQRLAVCFRQYREEKTALKDELQTFRTLRELLLKDLL